MEWYLYFLTVVVVKHIFSFSSKLVNVSFIVIRFLDGNVSVVFRPGALNVSHGALVSVST